MLACRSTHAALVCDIDLEHWEGTEPSLNAADVEIVIGKVKGNVSRSRISNPCLLGPAPRPFSLLFA